ncbi:hypothetical protein [Agrilutibacter niabensis]|uniref:hypothetical protein n=1 Tax=Agrilutibacter niabensis TaxID=380628 RepID=UPI0036DA9C47
MPFARDTPIAFAFAISAAAPMLAVPLVSMSVDQLLGKLLSIIASSCPQRTQMR